MSHELSIVNGRAEMFSGNNQVPWHKLGTVVSGTLTAQEAIKTAHLDWLVQSEPFILQDGRTNKDYQVLSRTDNRAILAVMKQRYEIIQNAECFDFMDVLAGENQISYETAGALRGGKQVWMLAKYDGDLAINGDKHQQWLLLVTSHDGSYSLMLQWVTVRVVCANTLSIALNGASNQIKIRHCKNWECKADEAKRVLGLTQDYFSKLQVNLNGLNEKPLTVDGMAKVARSLYPAQDETDVPTRTRNIRTELVTLFQRGQGNVGRSRWDALNAVTDYIDHSATIRGENSTRLESALLTGGSEIKQRAFDLLTNNHRMEALVASN